MNLFQRLFQKKKTGRNEEQQPAVFVVPEYEALRKADQALQSLLEENKYIPKSTYLNILEEEKTAVEYFSILDKGDVLSDFCRKNVLPEETIKEALVRFQSYETLIDEKNETYIQKQLKEDKDYLDHLLEEVDSKIVLDEDQRRVILTDEDYCLVIAGAGAGKTTTVAAKVKYLVEKQDVDPSQILVISFTNKAVQELKERINRDLAIPCPIATFHSTGNAILRKQNDEKLNIADPSRLYYCVLDYFKSSILKDESLVNQLILFFSTYFDAPYEGADLNAFFNKIAKSSFTTMKSDLEEYRKEIIDTRTGKHITIQNEVLRSYQEVEVANFLYLNGIDYEYEPIYRYDIQYARKPYTPDFIITQGTHTAYIEHFGITESGENSRYSKAQLETYKKAINDKVLLHRKHGSELIYTFSAYNDHRPLTEHLQEELERHGFTLKPRSNEEIMEKLVSSEENKYIRKLVSLISRFITNFKTNGYRVEEFDRMYHSTNNVRSRLFLNICKDCFLEYEQLLRENHAIDFQDMINESARILEEVKEMKQKLDFKYVIVDEYQDISRQRYDLVTALSEVTNAKIIAVGDDWQSIYAFSGSDISLFTKFAEKMGYAKMLKITRTYRNAQEVIDIAGQFIQKNKSQIEKDLISLKTIQDPVIIYTYNNTSKERGGRNEALAHAVETALDEMIRFCREEGKSPKNASVLLLGRYGFDGDILGRSSRFDYVSYGSRVKSRKYPFLKITFMTAHASKGLGYDNVIIINGKNETYGFPSKIEDDPVLSFVIKGDRSIDYAEERRLFYVAMTRTKNRVFFVAPESNPSEFLLEIKHDYKNVVLKGSWNEKSVNKSTVGKFCPVCGYPMQFRYKNAYGLRLWLCTNEPEVCGFMTNEYKAGRLGICKCDQCRDGYLIVKPFGKKKEYFLGCTNYKKDGTGCTRVMSRRYYEEIMNFQKETLPAVSVHSQKNVS